MIRGSWVVRGVLPAVLLLLAMGCTSNSKPTPHASSSVPADANAVALNDYPLSGRAGGLEFLSRAPAGHEGDDRGEAGEMSNRRADRPSMPGYGVSRADEGSRLLPWRWAEERLERSHDYWLDRESRLPPRHAGVGRVA